MMSTSQQIRVVIADDAPFIREVLRHIFTSHEDLTIVAETKDGNEVVETVLGRDDVDVVLMDIVMPNKGGIAATEEILAQKPDVKVIAFSTLDQESMVMKALDAGCCSYITKPFQSSDIVDAVRKAVQ